MAEDAGSKMIAVRFINENDYKNISTGTLFAKQNLKQNHPYWLVSREFSSDSSEYESCSVEERRKSVLKKKRKYKRKAS